MVGVADLVTVNAAVRVAGTVTDDGGDTGAVTPAGGVPVAVAVLAIEPASISACVTVYVAVQSTLAPGANAPGGHVATGAVPVPVNAVSVTAGSVMVTLPVLVTTNVYVTTSPAAVTVVGVADLVTVNAAVCVAGTVTDDGGDTGAVDTRRRRTRRGRSVGDRTGIDIGLRHRVRRRAVHTRPRRQRTRRTRHHRRRARYR